MDGCSAVELEKVYTVAEILDEMKDYTNNQVSEKQYVVSGKVSSSSYNSKYGSYTIWLENGDTAQAFELYSVAFATDSEDYHEANALVGYTVTCKGYLKLYGTTYEICYLSNIQFTPSVIDVIAPVDDPSGGEEPEEEHLSVSQALAIFATLESGAVYGNKVWVTGNIVSVGNIGASYVSNIVIADTADSAKTLLIYSCNWDTGTEATDKYLHAGDTIEVYGWLKVYHNNTTNEDTNEIADNNRDYPVFVSVSHPATGHENSYINDAKAKISVPSTVSEETALTTSVTICGKPIAITWTSDNGQLNDDSNAIVVTEGSNVDIVLTATFTLDEVNQTQTYNVTVKGEEESSTGSVTYDFSTTGSINKGTKLDNDSALTLFGKATTSTSTGLTAVSVTSIYDGNGNGGGDYANTTGILKSGTSSAAGELTLTFTGKKVKKVEIKCRAWNDTDGKVSVNGSAAQTPSYTTDETLTFNLSESSSTVTFSFNKRVFILEIVVYFDMDE